jgi:hypothetical protein
VTFAELLGRVIRHLEANRIPWMLTGSLAGSYHGEPRASIDADIVIDPSPVAMARLVDGLLADGFYADRAAADDALRDRGQFNAIAPDGLKVDFIVRKDRPFSIEELRRRQPADLLGTPGFVVSAEDLVIAKLEWAAETGSERQLQDATRIVQISSAFDVTYVDAWAARLGIGPMWSRIRAQGES